MKGGYKIMNLDIISSDRYIVVLNLNSFNAIVNTARTAPIKKSDSEIGVWKLKTK